jgi:hypothetical protein
MIDTLPAPTVETLTPTEEALFAAIETWLMEQEEKAEAAQ